VSGLRPESLTSSTVSPIERTSVALTNETTMYASNWSLLRFLTVQTAFGLPGSSETARSETERPCCTTRSVDRAERPQSETREGGAPRSPSSSSFASIIGQSESMSSTCSRLRSGRGSSSTTACSQLEV
jgi:hypothetical protein